MPAFKSASLVFGRFRGGTIVKPEVDAWIDARRAKQISPGALALGRR